MVLGTAGVLHAAPLKSAKIEETKNDVRLVREGQERAAVAGKDVIEGKDILHTGKKSRAELVFADKSIARLGSNTAFNFDPETREMKIGRGTALIHVPPGLSGAKISSPAATAAILGDVLAMRVNEKGTTEIIALSKDEAGPIQVTLHKTGETRILEPGELLTIGLQDLRMPEPMPIAVDVMVQTSSLIGEKPLPETATREIQKIEQIQQQDIRSGTLEGDGRVTAKADQTVDVKTSSTDSSVLQCVKGGRHGGSYAVAGSVTMGPDCPVPGGVGTFSVQVGPDGNLTGSGVAAGGTPFTITGFVNPDGTWSATSYGGGIASTATGSCNGTKVQGSVFSEITGFPGCEQTITATKQ